MKKQLLFLGLAGMLAFSCQDDNQFATSGTANDFDGDGIANVDDKCPRDAGIASLDGCPEAPKPVEPSFSEKVDLMNHSEVPAYFKINNGFDNVNVYSLLSSRDVLPQSPKFVYGSMADGAGLIRNEDDTYTLINNIEADYSIARITLDDTFKPVKGEYILNAEATANTAQCSGSLITPAEHGFGPLYLSGGEWGGNSKGVFAVDPYKNAADASTANKLSALGSWSTENAVAIGKDAYADKTVVFIGDDDSNNSIPEGHLGMYVGNRGDLEGGKLYILKVDGLTYEMEMSEGKTYDASFVEMKERSLAELNTEALNAGTMGFSRLEDIDWRRGSAKNQRELYLTVTGRRKSGLAGKGTFYGRIYKVELNENDPASPAKITCVLDGDKVGGKASMFHSPDNIVVTQNYAYIQEDPNGYFDAAGKDHWARVYQYNLRTGVLKTVLECDQDTASANGIGNTNRAWEITGMIDISEQIGQDAFLMITQNHGWERADGKPFTDPNANTVTGSRKEGSQLFVVTGLPR